MRIIETVEQGEGDQDMLPTEMNRGMIDQFVSFGQAIQDYFVDFLVWLPDRLFALVVKMLVRLTNLCYLAAEREIEQSKPRKGLSKKHLEMLYEVYASNRDGGMRGRNA